MKKLFIILFLGLMFLSMASAVTNQSLIAYYDLNEPNGASFLTDRFNFARNLTNTGGILGTQAVINGGFNASQKTGFANNFSDYGLGNNWSVSIWFNLTTFTPQAIPFSFGSNSYYVDLNGSTGAGVPIKTGNISFFYSGANHYMGTTLSGNQSIWNHLVMVQRDTTISCYINGVPCNLNLSTTIAPPAIFNIASPRTSKVLGEGINGTLDEIAIFNRSLTAQDVRDLYGNGLGLNLSLFTNPNNITGILISPTNGNVNSSSVIILTANASTTNGQNLTNMTIYVYNSTSLFNLSTKSVFGSINTSSWNISDLSFYENYTWNVLSCTTYNNCIFAPLNFSFIQSFTINSEAYNANTLVGNVETFIINITIPSGVSFDSGILRYSNLSFTPTLSSIGNDKILNASITIPSNLTGSNLFFWSFTLNGININSTAHTQATSPISSPSVGATCGFADYSPALNFTLVDEANFTGLTSDITYNFRYGITNSSFFVSNGTLSNTGNFIFCFNFSTSSFYKITSFEVAYNAFPANSYVVRKYYLFDDMVLTNNTNNLTLYDLPTADATSYAINVLALSSLLPYSNNYISLLRWYPEKNQYYVVEMGKTGDNGESLLRAKSEDIDYRIAVYERNGTLLKLTSPKRMVCLVNPCTYTIYVEDESEDFTSFQNIQYSIDFNETTGIWTFIWNDASQRTTLMNLTIFKDTGDNSIPVCTTSSTGFTGVMSCNTSSQTGNLRAMVYRSASPPVLLVSKLASIFNSAFKSTFGLFLAVLIGIPIMFIFALINPVIAIIGGVIVLIPALYLGAISWAILGGIIVLGAIIIHILKRTT